MKKILLASLMTICVAASASALDVNPYIGFFPISYHSDTNTNTNQKDVDTTSLNIGISPLYVGVKVYDFRTDFMVDGGFQLTGFNCYYDFNISDSLLPYIKIGIHYENYTGENKDYKEEIKRTAYAIGAGIGYKVVNNFILDAGIEYNRSKYDYKLKYLFSGVTNKSKSTSSGLAAKMGARLQF